ncbi:60S acidic ribosomal protein P2 [Toxocara canis]|uniref:Large ribosomal subunit protein P2 n=1 Tax=Toxocara canis TaxID=6265 RepID=A0A0B2V1V8_TOXCA|nr:60S acidic ribosomal protein P2 [Toxocara canis]
MHEYGGRLSSGPNASSCVQELKYLFETRSRLQSNSFENGQLNRVSVTTAPRRVSSQLLSNGSRIELSTPQRCSQFMETRPALVKEKLTTRNRPPIAPKPMQLCNFPRDEDVRNELQHVRLRPVSHIATSTKRRSTPNEVDNITAWRSSNESSKNNKSRDAVEEERLTNLSHAAHEIYTEEQKFMQKLDLLTEQFNSFLNEPHAWEKGDSKKIADHTGRLLYEMFNELIKIREAHRGLFEDLRSIMKNWNELKPDMGPCVGKHSKQLMACFDFLNKRSRFVEEFKKALEIDIVFKERTKKFEEIYLNGLSYLCELDIVHQNVVRYVPLLEKYSKYLVPNSLEEAIVKNVTLAIYQVVDELNQKLDQSIMLARQYKLSQRFDGNFDALKDGRTLRYEGEVREILANEQKPRYFVLFSDVLVIAKASRESDALITNYVCVPLDKISAHAEQHIERERYLTLQLNQSSETITTTYLADCKMVRDTWVKKINDAALKASRDAFGCSSGQIDDVSLSSSISYGVPSLPSYIPNAKSTTCMMEGCQTKFKRKMKKPHCRQCGWIMCDKCTGYAPIQSTFEVEKVCPECYESNMEKFFKDQLLPEYMVDKSSQITPSSMTGVRINISGKSSDWKEFFIAPPNGIRPKIALSRIQEGSIASGTLIIKSKVGVEKVKWGRLQQRFDSLILSLYDAELINEANKKKEIRRMSAKLLLTAMQRILPNCGCALISAFCSTIRRVFVLSEMIDTIVLHTALDSITLCGVDVHEVDGMKYLGAYLLAVLGGNPSPTAKDIERILGSVGLDVDMEDANKVVSALSGKSIDEVITAGRSKIESVPCGGGAGQGAAAPAAAAPAAAAAAPEPEKKKEEPKEESDDEDMGFGLFD